MSFRFFAAAGVVTLAAVVTIPASSARADSFRNDQWYLKSLRISQAQSITKGSGVTVAVVDSGSYPHPDVKRNLLAGISVMPGADKNGHNDSDGHGTGMAAIIGAHGKNGQDGVLGIAPAARILPVKFTDSDKSAPADLMGKGVEWAAAHGATIINVSAETGPAFSLIGAVTAAIEKDIVIVAGVGNTRTQSIISYPAAIDGVLVVGATDRNGKHASLSVTDPKVEICAPGVDITTARPKSGYADIDGTSASTAIVSGAAALVRAKFPDLSGPEVIHRLTATADDVGPPGRDSQCGFGELNIVKALTADVAPLGGGSASPSVSAGATTPPDSPAPTTPSAAPEAGSGGLVVGVLAVAVVAGALVGVLLVRRRRAG